MKRKSIKYLAFLLFGLAISVNSAYAFYLLNHYLFLGETTVIDSPNLSQENCKVIFNYNNSNKTIIVKKGDTISVSDAPINELNGNPIKWIDTNGNVIFNPQNNVDSYIVNTNLDMRCEEIDYSKNIDDATEIIRNTSIATRRNEIILKEESKEDHNTIYPMNEVSIGGQIDNCYLEANYCENFGIDYQYTHNNFERFKYQVNNKTTIGLEDKTSVASDYKPLSGENSSNKNYCVNRIKLNSDLYLTGGTSFVIGGKCGFYGDNDGYSQHNFQGMIIGNYSELDLCGHNLFIGSGSSLTVYGSITNSGNSGEVIIQNGGSMTASVVIEDQNHETAMPTTYSYGDQPFSMYRMPYINCNIKVNYGGKLIGHILIDLGGANWNYYEGDLTIIGNNSDALIQLSDANSYITREVYYDNEIKNNTLNSSFIRNNLMYQKIKYSIFNHQNSYANVNAPIIEMSISGVNFKVDFDKVILVVPPYFDFYLFNTKIVLKNNITFLVGSYLFADKLSEIRFSYKEVKTFTKPGDYNFINSAYQGIGGLNFANYKYDFQEAVNKWIDDGDSIGGTTSGGTNTIYKDASQFWSYLSNNKPAKCDMEGIFTFDTNITNFLSPFSNRYSLGGEINIKNIEVFKNTINEINKEQSVVNLYNVTFKSALNKNRKQGSSILQNPSFNVVDYYVSPLVSNGNVLMDIKSNISKVRNDYDYNKISFDKKSGLIICNDGSLYGYIFSKDGINYNSDCSHLNKANCGDNGSGLENTFKNTYDDLSGKFVPVNYYSNNDKNIITCSIANSYGSTYVYFRGAFFPYNVIDKTINIGKLRSGTSSYNGTDNNRKISWVNYTYYGYETWRLD